MKRWSVEKRNKAGGLIRFGVVQETPEGRFRFFPHVGGRLPSRKQHDYISSAIPRWVGKEGIDYQVVPLPEEPAV